MHGRKLTWETIQHYTNLSKNGTAMLLFHSNIRVKTISISQTQKWVCSVLWIIVSSFSHCIVSSSSIYGFTYLWYLQTFLSYVLLQILQIRKVELKRKYRRLPHFLIKLLLCIPVIKSSLFEGRYPPHRAPSAFVTASITSPVFISASVGAFKIYNPLIF